MPLPEGEMPEKPSLKSWRHWFWISVRGSIVLVLFVGGWLGWVVRSPRIQHQAVGAIEEAGGTVFYDWQYQRRDRPRW